MSAMSTATRPDSRPVRARAGQFRRALDLMLQYNFIIIFFLVVVIAALLSDNFLTFRNVSNLFQQAAVVGIVAVGMSFVILTGNIDLSVGSMAAFGGMLGSVAMASGLHPLVALAAVLAVGSAGGAIMGGISAYAKVPSFIVTLAGLVTVRGLTYLMSDGVPIGGLPHAFGAFGTMGVPLFPGSDQLFPMLGLVFVLIGVLGTLVLRFTVFGEYIYASGGNAEAAGLSGVPTRAIITATFAISGFLAGLSGMLLAARLRIGQPTAAQGLELDAIAAVVLGGTSLSGGRGGVIGTVFAVMLLQVVRNIFNLLGLGSFYQMTITGLIIIAAILLNRAIDHRTGR
jgi:ribose transport system permease protein